MIVKSINGFIKYYPQEREDLIRFKSIFGIDLYREDDYFTFENLIGIPRYSIAGMPYAGILAVKTYEGRHASDVMRENGFVYNLELEAIVPMLALPNSVNMVETLNYATTPKAFIQPGARLDGRTTRILSYSAWLSLDFQKLYLFDRELI